MLDSLQIHVPVRALRSLVGNLKERYRRERRSIRIYRWFSCARITRKKDSLPHTENEFQEEPKQKKKKDDDGMLISVDFDSDAEVLLVLAVFDSFLIYIISLQIS